MTPRVPVLVRVTGLSARVLAPFGDPGLGDALEGIEALRQTLDSAREQGVEQIYRQLPEVEPEERRFLLTLKRDCHNRRSIAAHRRHRLWPSAVARTGDGLERIVEIEGDLARREDAFRTLYSQLQARERRALHELATGPWLRRGLALASPDLMEGLSRHQGQPRDGRRARRLETSLLRYLSRAALKTSPYSTLTPVALADLGPAGGEGAIRYVPGPRRDRSLVRVKRYLLDQICRLLLRHPPVQETLRVGLNPSLELLETGEYRFLRPPNLQRSEGDGAEGRLEKAKAAQVTVRLGGDLVPFLCRRLANSELPFRSLIEAAAAHFGGAEPASSPLLARGLQQLLDLGLLEIRLPWPSYEPSLEACLLEFLESLPAAIPAAIPPAMTAALRELVALEAGFAGAADPVRTVRRIDDLVIALYEEAYRTLEPEGKLPLVRTENRNYYEDVFLAPLAPDRPCLLELGRSSLLRALDAGDLVWRLSYLFEPRHEALFALEDHLATHHAEEARVPVAELFAETRRLWASYRRHVDEGRPGAFDPHGSPGIAELVALRSRVEERLAEPFPVEDEVERLPVELLRSLLSTVPRRFLPAVGPCLFLQPCDSQGETWVANGRFEGTGRMSCRFNVALDPASRELYVDHYAARSVLKQDGERVELVDMLFTKANTVNIHWPQTRRVLLMPGEAVDLPAERVLRFTDLYVERRAGLPLRLVTAAGERIVPCFLSPLDFFFVPTVLRFLDLFGVHPERTLPLTERPQEGEGCRVYRRRKVDNLVLRRRRWTVLPEALPTVASGAAGFAELHRWRLRLGLPAELYFLGGEPAGAGGSLKPQYVDFQSPSFIDLLALGIESSLAAGQPLTLIEALPGPESFPVDPEEGPRIFEVMLESLALVEVDENRGGLPSL